MKKLVASILCGLLLLPAFAWAEVLPYSRVYEPETSFVLASTIAWNADATAAQTAAQDVRPGTALVYVDKDLKVTAADGTALADSLEAYVADTAETMIPALYIRDEAAAAALKAYLESSGLGDVFVAASHENAALVKEVAQLLHVRGMVDFRDVTASDRDTLVDILRTTNGAYAKVALLSPETATEDAVHFLQGRLLTVWVATPGDTKSLLTQYTNGVNGILVDDYRLAIDTLGFFHDDAPSLLRVPNIVGHRGMPSVYVENTTLSAIGAYEAGADAIENDIHLSADRELFVNHDESLARLFDRGDIPDASVLSIAEIQAIPFVNDGDNGVQARNNQTSENARYGYIKFLPSQRMPTLREFFVLFKNSGVVHDTEIKSSDPRTVGALRNLVAEMDNFDEVFVITFNKVILEEMYAAWPEMSVGALGMQGYGDDESYLPAFADFTTVAASDGVEKAVELLYGEIDKWNATFNPHLNFEYDVAVAGRHRGLTVWPWTYNTPEQFADGYLKGLYGLTTNFAWWATDFIKDIRAEDVTIAAGDALPAPFVTTQNRQAITTPEEMELLVVEGSLDTAGSALCIYRLRQELVVDGQSFGNYYLYSNPFTVTVE